MARKNNPHPSRREWLLGGALGLGGLDLVGLNLPGLLAAEEAAGRPRAKAKSCILFFMEGGPAHQDLWDLKPEAPLEYRGEFRSIRTRTPGVQVCEHLPLLARQMHHFAQVRSVHHDVNDHNAGAYYCLTGHSPRVGNKLIISPGPSLFPSYGAALSRLRPTGSELPDFIHIPEVLSNNSYDLPGQFAGFFGRQHDPYVTGDPSLPAFNARRFELSADVTRERFLRRRLLREKLLESIGSTPGGDKVLGKTEPHYRKAFELLSSSKVRDAFDLSREPAKVRERYGFDRKSNRAKQARQFGGVPHLGQSMLLARRLVEAGSRLVTVCAGRRYCQAWDTHRQHFPLMKRSLLPLTDRALSALLEDLAERGLLDETLVVVMGEFGRTPKIGQVTSNAGADKGGRDHWPHCYSVLLAGAGISGGAVYGKSDRHAAFPESNPVSPEDIAATIYDLMGLESGMEITDRLDRTVHLSDGTPIREIYS